MTLAAGAIVASAAMAIPAKRGLTTTLATADGRTVEATLAGDEFAHYYTATDGRCYTLDAQGRAVTADPAEIRKRAAARAVTRSRGMTHAKGAPAHRMGTSDKLSDYCIGSLGDIRIPVILVDYTDRPFTQGDDAKATFTDFFQTGEKSGRQYFLDNSNGRFRPQFDVYGPYHLSQNRAYYGGNDSNGKDRRVGEMVAEGCTLATDIDYSLYDNDGDGNCDVVIFIYAGNGEAQSGIANTVWPCQWNLTSSEYSKSITIGGVGINNFAVFNELNGTSTSRIDGIGTFAHEFSHCLGLPDYYSTGRGEYYGMGSWSLMDYGAYNDSGYTPLGYSAYDKLTMGWIDEIPEPVPGSTLTLPVFNQKSADTDVAYRLTGKSPDEYYVIENRDRQGWDQYMTDEGLMIYHVTYNRENWDYNWVNSQNPLGMAMVCADNRRDDYTESTDLFPYGGKNAFTDNTSPAATLNSGGKLGKPITNITRDSSTGIVTCTFMEGASAELPAPDLTGANAPTNESMQVTDNGFTPHWPAVTADTDITYTLEVRPHIETVTTLIAEADFSDTNTWETEGYAEIEAGGGLRLGSNKQLGGVISPEFAYTGEGMISVAISANAYSNDTDVELNVLLCDADGSELQTEPITLSASTTTYIVKFENCAPANYSVAVESTEKKKRAILHWIRIYSGDASDAAAQTPAMRADSEGSLLFEGITDTSYKVTGLTPGATYDWRVKTVPVNPAVATDSRWTQWQTVTINDTSAITVISTDTPASEAEYFDLTGRRVTAPGAGIYIVRRGTRVTKEILR